MDPSESGRWRLVPEVASDDALIDLASVLTSDQMASLIIAARQRGVSVSEFVFVAVRRAVVSELGGQPDRPS